MANAASSDPHPQIRLYLDLPFKAGLLIEPSPAQCHYLLTVMRQPSGGMVALFNGVDGEWRATIEPAGRRSCRLALRDQIRPQRPEPGPALLFAPLKRMRQEMLVEKATELGVSRLQPVFCLRSVVDRVSSARLFGIAAEAAEQCGRLTVPAIDAPLPLDACLEARAEGRPLYLGDETRTGRPLLDALREFGAGDLLIGPEGGFATDELSGLKARPEVVAVSLGPRVLRAETAALAALACWQAVLQPDGAGAG